MCVCLRIYYIINLGHTQKAQPVQGAYTHSRELL